MKHIIYEILDEYQLTNAEDIMPHLQAMSADDLSDILDKLEDWYAKQRDEFVAHTKENTLFSIWLPRTKVHSIAELSARFVIADTILADDTLYNYLAGLNKDKMESSWASFGPIAKDFSRWHLQSVYEEIAKLIEFYLSAKDLVLEDRFLPFVDMTTAPILTEEGLHHLRHRLLTLNPAFEQNMNAMFSIIKSQKIDPIRDKYAIRDYSKWFYELESLVTSLSYNFAFSKLPLASIDLLDDHIPSLLNDIIKVIQAESSERGDTLPITPFSQSELVIPTLGQVPLSEILEIKQKEKDSFERFKVAVLSRVNGISSEPGSDSWEREISKLRLELSKDVKEIEMTLEHLKKDFSRRFSIEISALAFSVAIASFGVLGSGMNTATILQTITGGAGLVTSLRAIASNWLAFRKEKETVQRKESYYLWRLKKSL